MRNIFNKCHRVSRLLYLYRDGELSPKEKSLVENHTHTCSECASILNKLKTTDSCLEHFRTAAIASTNAKEVINAALQQINNQKAQSTKYQAPSTISPPWLRPALIGSLAIILCVLCYQQLRDALKSSILEHRLKQQTPLYVMKQLSEERETGALLRKWQNQEKLNIPLSLPQSRAAAGNQIYDKVLALWRQLFENKNGFLDYLSNKYPELSAISVDDGLDKRERIILSTEGKALIKELEQLMKDEK